MEVASHSSNVGHKGCSKLWWVLAVGVVVVAAAVVVVVLVVNSDGNDSTSFNFNAVVPTASNGALFSAYGLELVEFPEATHVFCVCTACEYGQEWRKLVPIQADGSFQAVLTADDPWVLIFIKPEGNVGAEMVQGSFSAATLDSVRSFRAGSAEVGLLSFNSTTGKLSIDGTVYEDFLKDLGISDAFANKYGDLDDQMLRYTNPDLDGDGTVDMLLEGFPTVDFHFSNAYYYGSNNSQLLEDYVQQGKYLPLDLGLRTKSATAELRLGKEDGMTVDAKWLKTYGRFTMGWTDYGDWPGEVFEIDNTTWTLDDIAGPSAFDDVDNPGYKVIFYDTDHMPSGTYTFRAFDPPNAVPVYELNFTNVITFANASNTAGFVFPWAKLESSGGVITGVEVTWKEVDANGDLVDTTPETIEGIIGKKTAEVKLHSPHPSGGSVQPPGMSWTIKPFHDAFALKKSYPISEATSEDLWSDKLEDQITLALSFDTLLGVSMQIQVDQDPGS